MEGRPDLEGRKPRGDALRSNRVAGLVPGTQHARRQAPGALSLPSMLVSVSFVSELVPGFTRSTYLRHM